MTVAAGTRLGPYEIVAPLGAGGMGEVWRAKDTRLGRDVAIKVLPASFARDETFRARFDREAKSISSLNHPHICTLHDVGHQEGIDYLVMELLEGESLADRLEKGPMPPDQVLRLGAQIADALHHAHRQGIVHRDLKPGNVMLTRSGAKLLDFGLARTAAGASALQGLTTFPTQAKPLTAEGAILGTFQYMAPEQLEGREADARTDIFALGSVLYEMATGRKAFSGTSQASLVSAVMKEDPAPISAVRPMSPPALDRVVRTCLAKDPEERWQSAADIKSELRWIADGAQGGTAVAAAPRRGAWLPWAMAVLAVLVAAGTLLVPRRTGSSAAPRMILSILPPPAAAWTDWFALSPDGSRLALVGSNEGRMQIWIRRFDEEEAHPLAGTEGAEDPFWSPDGRSLAFFSQGKLKKIELGSGAVQVLCDAGLGRGGAWGRQGVILFTGGASSAGLSRVSASGGVPAEATRFESSRGDSVHRWPYFLPDGKRFLVFVWTGNLATTGIYMGSLESQDLKLLQPSHEAGQFLPPDQLLYARGDALVVQRLDLDRAQPYGEPETIVPKVDVAEVGAFLRLFSVSQSGIVAFRDAGNQRPLVWFDRRGKVLGRTSAVAGVGSFSLSPDEGLAAYSTGTQTASDVWILDLGRDVPTKSTSENVANSPLFSRDGRSLYYRFLGAKHFQIRRKPVGSSGPEETLFEGNGFESPQDETPDGNTLIVQSTRGNFDIWALPLQGDRKLFPLVATPFSERAPRLSPDGRWLAYYSDESGRFEVYVRRFPVTGEKWQISTRGGIWPYWRGDGREIYYVGLGGVLMAAPVAAGQSFSVGAPDSLFQTSLRAWTVARQYAASRDGQRFLIIDPSQDPAASPMNVLLNWHAQGERK